MRLIELETLENPFSDIFETLKRDCSHILSLMDTTKSGLFRGTTKKPDFYKMSPRHNREPQTSSLLGQQLYDEYLAKLGIVARRSNSFFTTRSRKHASMYGKTYVVFPLDGFKFSWSRYEDDIILRNNLSGFLNVDSLNKLINGLTVPENIGWFEASQENAMLTRLPLHRTQGEIHASKIKGDWSGDKEILTNIETLEEEYGNIPIWDIFDFNLVDAKFKATDTNLENVMSQIGGWEILIHGEVYGLAWDTYREQLISAFPYLERSE